MHGVSGETTPGTLSPTISSIASDLSLEDITTMHGHAKAPSVSSDVTVKKHPVHFIKDNMVEIQVMLLSCERSN
jgi:metallophosphoesterase superfamily enzyme